MLKDFQQELIRRLELAQRLQDSVKADSCLTDDDRIRLSNLEAAVIRIQRLADARLAKLHAALKLVWFPDGLFVNYCMPNIDEGPCQTRDKLLLNKVAQATVSFPSANNRQTNHASIVTQTYRR